MENIWLIAIISIIAVGIFALGLSITLIVKGHNIKSEIGDNENMRARGIKCAAQQMRDQESVLAPAGNCTDHAGPCPPAGCGSGQCDENDLGKKE